MLLSFIIGSVFINDEYVWKVARYTSAAPIYFTEFEDYVDGGVLAQNPSVLGLTAIQKHFNESGQQLPISLVVSIGTGKVSEESAHIGDIDATEVLVLGKQWLSAVRGLSERIKSLSTLLSNAVSCIVKSFHGMKGCRDGKSAKTSATRNCLYGAVVVNDHNMYPHPHLHHFFMFL